MALKTQLAKYDRYSSSKFSTKYMVLQTLRFFKPFSVCGPFVIRNFVLNGCKPDKIPRVYLSYVCKWLFLFPTVSITQLILTNSICLSLTVNVGSSNNHSSRPVEKYYRPGVTASGK